MGAYMDKNKSKLQGVAVPVVTPFDENFKLNLKELKRHIRFLVKSGIDVLILTGTLGECETLTVEERKKIVEVAAEEVSSSLPFVVCVNHTSFFTIIELAKHAQKMGAKAVMVMAPYYRRLSEGEIFSFYETISKSVDIDIMLYNNPALNKVDMSEELILSLAELPNVIALKETTPNLRKFEWTMRIVGEKISVFNGFGERIEPSSYIMGEGGFVSVIANFIPEVPVRIRRACLEGNFSEAERVHDLIVPLFDLVSSQKIKQPVSFF